MSEEKKKRGFVLRRSDRIVLGVVLALAVIAAVLTIMKRFFGLAPANGALLLHLPALALAVLIGWVFFSLIRRIRRTVPRRIMTVVMVAVMVMLVTLGMLFLSYWASYAIPQRYTVIASPAGGHRLVVLRAPDRDEDETRISVRRAARLADDPEGDPGIGVDDVGYEYTAWPQALGGLFYRTDADAQGAAYIGLTSGATLMVEWPDEDTAHFFIQDPRPGDEGEITVRFK